MTPLALRCARELTLPKRERTFDDRAGVLGLFTQDMHCFEVSAIAGPVNAVLDDPYRAGDEDEAWTVWRDVESMAANVFLPSPVTWLEQVFGNTRIALVLSEAGDYFRLGYVVETRRGLPDFSIPGIFYPTKAFLYGGRSGRLCCPRPKN